jgi:hypothetical protein
VCLAFEENTGTKSADERSCMVKSVSLHDEPPYTDWHVRRCDAGGVIHRLATE